jgi:hypothetical protein
VTTEEITALHDSLPLTAPDRHDLEDPALIAAFRHQASDHPDAVKASIRRRLEAAS